MCICKDAEANHILPPLQSLFSSDHPACNLHTLHKKVKDINIYLFGVVDAIRARVAYSNYNKKLRILLTFLCSVHVGDRL